MNVDELIKQLGATIAAPLEAQRLAFVDLVNALSDENALNKNRFCKRLEATAQSMPAEVLNPEAIARHVYALAQAIRESRTIDGSHAIQ